MFCGLIHFVSELFECSVAVAPVFQHLDAQLQEAAFAGERLNLFASLGAEPLD